MRCGKTRLIEIRNFEDFSIEPVGNMTVLTGKNGAGKTNIIEAIYFASVGKSFRTSNDEELIRLDKEEGTILLDFTVRGVTHEIKIKLSRNKGKKILINETATKKKDLMGMFRTVLFTPDELQLIKGAPQNRRRFIDLEISQVSPRYYEEILHYGRAVQQRNAAFKEARFHGFMADVDIWDMQIAKRASYIVKKRMETIEKMNEIVLSESGDELKILGENFKIRERDYARKKENDIFVEEYYGKSEIEQNGNKIEARIIKSDYYNLKDKKDKNNEDSLKINLKKENSVCEAAFDFKNKNIIVFGEKEPQNHKKGNNLADIKQGGILEKKEKLTSKEMENELEKFLETKDNACGKFLK